MIPKVSICCTTYNHSSYVSACLDGILMQKINFSFEILIHDDASTDDTATIIRSYEKQFPNVIKPIYQTENQYSKGIKCNLTYNFPRVKGKYIAICEGDDYWTDPLKLQKQFDFMESNLEYSYCGHLSSSLKEDILNKIPLNVQELTFDKLIFKNYLNTATLFFRKDVIIELPKEFSKIPGGDWGLQLIALQYGKGFILNENMSVYRIHEQGAWSSLKSQEQCMAGVRTQEFFKKVYIDEESLKIINKAIETRKNDWGIKQVDFKTRLIRKLKRVWKKIAS